MKIKLSYEEIERLHDAGKMPDWWYYQVNGKTANENYVTIYNKRQQETKELLEQRNLDAIVEAELDKQIPKLIDKAIKDAFKSFGK